MSEYLDATQAFDDEESAHIQAQIKDGGLSRATHEWIRRSMVHRYTYHFKVLGRPIIQFPQDIVAMQELIWKVKPDLIVETGIAHGGSLALSASMLALLEYSDAVQAARNLDFRATHRRVIGIDVDIRAHNRAAIEAHFLSHMIEMVEGSSTDPDVIDKVRRRASGFRSVLVCLDSNHTHEHVLAELQAYTPFISKGGYCVVSDTIIEDLPEDSFGDRPWGKANNPRTAIAAFLKKNDRFVVDDVIDARLLISNGPGGYLKCIKD